MRQSRSRTKSLELGHIGMVVKSLDEAVKFLSALGVEPFTELSFDNKFNDFKIMFRGKAISLIGTGKGARSNIGRVGLEIFQPTKGVTPYKEFLDKTGGGIHHLGFVVDDLEKEVASLTDKGARISSSVNTPKGIVAYYLEIDALPGIIIELMSVDTFPRKTK